MLLLAFGAAEDGENGHTESMSDEMGCPIFTRRPQSDNHFPGWKNNPFHNRDEAYWQSTAYYQCPDLRTWDYPGIRNGFIQKQRDSCGTGAAEKNGC